MFAHGIGRLWWLATLSSKFQRVVHTLLGLIFGYWYLSKVVCVSKALPPPRPSLVLTVSPRHLQTIKYRPSKVYDLSYIPT